MTQEQQENLQEQQALEAAYNRTHSTMEWSEAQLAVLTELDLLDDKSSILESAVASVVKGKMQSAIDRAIKAKYIAEGKGKKALAEECEIEIQKGLKLKRAL
jgi:hypothetical protein